MQLPLLLADLMKRKASNSSYLAQPLPVALHTKTRGR
jgi:hypothetical protein